MVTPKKSIKLVTTFKEKYKDPEIRSVIFEESTRSNDTKLFFEIADPKEFSQTQWGPKIRDKLQKQQAGDKRDKLIRILAINFSYSDTSDISFFNSKKYYDNLEKDIKFLASDMIPYPPFDIVLPCELGFECGFIKPINLSDLSDSFVDSFFSEIHLNKPIKSISQASDKEVDEIMRLILENDD